MWQWKNEGKTKREGNVGTAEEAQKEKLEVQQIRGKNASLSP